MSSGRGIKLKEIGESSEDFDLPWFEVTRLKIWPHFTSHSFLGYLIPFSLVSFLALSLDSIYECINPIWNVEPHALPSFACKGVYIVLLRFFLDTESWKGNLSNCLVALSCDQEKGQKPAKMAVFFSGAFVSPEVDLSYKLIIRNNRFIPLLELWNV